ncbi:hypothetical protein C1931_14685 [Stenotrophomonas sp. YAU14A_MKIMI4_1]|nr:hypothetical protein C1931_14685 [Stenotrophomonas sp. YAU14A_MKIMI4_1]
MLFERASKFLIPIEIHPRMAWIYWPPGPRDSPRDLSAPHLALVGVDLGRHGRSTPCVDALRTHFETFDSD